MAESSMIHEGDKLKGYENYYVWSLKMRGILRAEGHWAITEEEQNPEGYPCYLDGEEFDETLLRKKKAVACKVFLLSVSDHLINIVAAHTDPALVWKELKTQFSSRDQSYLLTLKSQLQSMKLSEGGSIEDYTMKARKLRDHLSNMGENITDRETNQVVLKRLPRSYESTIQTLIHISINSDLSFEQLCAHLLSESHRHQHRNRLWGEDEALAASMKQQSSGGMLYRPPN